MNKRRVVVTGMGIVSCYGSNVDEFYTSLLEGKSGVKLIERFSTENYPAKIAATVEDFDPTEYMDKKQARRADPFISFAMVAGNKALEMAGLSGDKLKTIDPSKAGVLVGSGMGGMEIYTEGVSSLLNKGNRRVSPFFVPYIITNMAGALLAMDFGFMGPNYSISTACATSNNCIIAAANHIRNGDADVMITGGVEAAIQPMGLSGFCALKALSQKNDTPEKASRPFDTDRDGFVMGEGAGVLVLESLEHAQKRGANIICEYLGGGLSCDAHHITEPHPEGKGVALSIERALEDAGISADDVNYVNAHATSTPVGDTAEIKAVQKVFKNSENVVMNATKSLVGHCLGAAGGVEAIATIMAIKTGEVHPNLNLENPEPSLKLQVPTKRQKLDIKAGISNSFGFGGHNAVVVFGPYKG